MASLLLQLNKLSTSINTIYALRIEKLREAFIEEGKEMVFDFRERQYASSQINSAKKNKPDTADKKNKAKQFAKKFENAPPKLNRGAVWFNRSFRAARSVFPYVDYNTENIAVGLYHTMSYGAYLEYANNRKYAALEPIVRSHSQSLIERVKKIMGGDNI